MRIITYNVNGIRAAKRKGFLDWLEEEPADIICLQEVKAMEEQVDLEKFKNRGFHVYWFAAEKKGYSGVAVLSKFPANAVKYGTGHEQSDAEGRVIQLDFDEFTLINAYFPSGSSGDHRQDYKYQWLDEFYEHVQTLKKEKENIIVVGDYNICHKAIDIHNPVSNKKSSGFLPEERAWMDKWFEEGKFIDTFRYFQPDPHHYSWWSYRANARANNKGWRIDYISVSENMEKYLKHAQIYPDVMHSDHCPVYAELDFS